MSDELKALGETLLKQAAFVNDPKLRKPVTALEKAASSVGKASSDSWLGYQSCVYYEGFSPPPPGAFFSSEWGLEETFSSLGSQGDWLPAARTQSE